MPEQVYMKGATIREVANTYQGLCYIKASNLGMDDKGRCWALMDAPVVEFPPGGEWYWLGVGAFAHGGKILIRPTDLGDHVRKLSGDPLIERHDHHWNLPQILSDEEGAGEWFRLWEPFSLRVDT